MPGLSWTLFLPALFRRIVLTLLALMGLKLVADGWHGLA